MADLPGDAVLGRPEPAQPRRHVPRAARAVQPVLLGHALRARAALRPAASRRGYGGQLYFANEEGGAEGRLFGVTEDGQAKQLPRLGLFSWENTKPAYDTGTRTVVAGNEDDAAGQLRLYTGTKRKSGDPFERPA